MRKSAWPKTITRERSGSGAEVEFRGLFARPGGEGKPGATKRTAYQPVAIIKLTIRVISITFPHADRLRDRPARWSEEMAMTEGLTPKPPGRVRGRPFEKGRSGNPLGRRVGCRNKTTIAAASLLASEAEALTRKAVELALVGDPTAMRLCLERILPPCRDRMVKFALPPIESAADIAAAMKAVTSALAGGMISPGEAATIAAELAMPDLDLIKQGEQGIRDRRGRFARGRSGNPPGGRAGYRDHVNRAARSL